MQLTLNNSNLLKVILLISILLLLVLNFKPKRYGNSVQMEKEWLNKKIIIIDSLKCINLNDINSFNGYKIVVSIDGQCTPCIEGMELWKEFLGKIPQCEEINFIFYIRSLNLEKISKELKAIDFKFPSYFDKNDIFYKTNHLPEDKLFNTMLLDKENRIVLIGDPLYNKELRKLYKKTVENEICNLKDAGFLFNLF